MDSRRENESFMSTKSSFVPREHPKGPRASELTSQYAERGSPQRKADVERHSFAKAHEAERRVGELKERKAQAERDKQIRFRSSGNVVPSWSHGESMDAYGRETQVLEQMKALDDRELDNKYLRPAFKRLDRDNSGAIDLSELRKVTKAMKCDLTEEQLKEMMKAADTDGNGQIEFEEFASLLRKQIREGSSAWDVVVGENPGFFGGFLGWMGKGPPAAAAKRQTSRQKRQAELQRFKEEAAKSFKKKQEREKKAEETHVTRATRPLLATRVGDSSQFATPPTSVFTESGYEYHPYNDRPSSPPTSQAGRSPSPPASRRDRSPSPPASRRESMDYGPPGSFTSAKSSASPNTSPSRRNSPPGRAVSPSFGGSPNSVLERRKGEIERDTSPARPRPPSTSASRPSPAISSSPGDSICSPVDLRPPSLVQTRGAYKCAECGQVFATISTLAMHKQLHTEIPAHRRAVSSADDAPKREGETPPAVRRSRARRPTKEMVGKYLWPFNAAAPSASETQLNEPPVGAYGESFKRRPANQTVTV